MPHFCGIKHSDMLLLDTIQHHHNKPSGFHPFLPKIKNKKPRLCDSPRFSHSNTIVPYFLLYLLFFFTWCTQRTLIHPEAPICSGLLFSGALFQVRAVL